MSSTVLEIFVSFFILFGCTFVLVGAIGLFRLPDVFMRLHAPTKATTLGIGAILTASAIFFSAVKEGLSLHEILITVFLFITAPVSGHLIAKAAIRMRVKTHTTGTVPEETPNRESPTPEDAHRTPFP